MFKFKYLLILLFIFSDKSFSNSSFRTHKVKSLICVSGLPGDKFWYVKTGGKETNWAKNSDATCLGWKSKKPVQWGKEGCVFGMTKEQCEKNFLKFKEGGYIYGENY